MTPQITSREKTELLRFLAFRRRSLCTPYQQEHVCWVIYAFTFAMSCLPICIVSSTRRWCLQNLKLWVPEHLEVRPTYLSENVPCSRRVDWLASMKTISILIRALRSKISCTFKDLLTNFFSYRYSTMHSLLCCFMSESFFKVLSATISNTPYWYV